MSRPRATKPRRSGERAAARRFTVVDLFCGAGGLSLGFARAGFEVALGIDSMEAAAETHAANLGHPVRAEEISTATALPEADVIVGGPPCQGFSSAGMRRSGDARNSLVSVFAKIVAAARPRAFVFENVEGFLTADNGARVLDLLDPLVEAGYCIHLRKINAANFGVPQLRKRVLAIGGLGWEPPFPLPTHTATGAPGAHLAGVHLPAAPTLGDAIGDLPRATTAPPGRLEDHYSRPLGADSLARIRALRPGQTMRDLPEDYWHESYRRRAYRRVMDGTPTERRGGAPAGLRRLRSDEPSKAITSGAPREFVHPSEPRPLTLRECARIQTFPDSFTFSGTGSDRAVMIGNAVPPVLAAVVAEHVEKGLRSVSRVGSTGRLLSFVPTLASGASPALDHVRRTIERRFDVTAPQITFTF